MQTTNNYGLRKPDVTDTVDIADLNYNADQIDTQIKTRADALAAHLTDGVQHKIVDAVTGAKFRWGIENGQMYLEEVS